MLEKMHKENEMFIRVQTEPGMSKEEIRVLLHKYPARSYLAYAEDRTYPIHMIDTMPARWAVRKPEEAFNGSARPGEFYVFQVGLYAARSDLKNIKVEYSDLVSPEGQRIKAEAFRCFNLGGVDTFGRRFQKQLTVPVGKLQALWFGLEIPDDIEKTQFKGRVFIKPEDLEEASIDIILDVDGEPMEEGGVNEPWRHSRLKWLDSDIAIDKELTSPYTPLSLENSTIKCLGRQAALGELGLPESLKSFFNYSIEITDQGREILAAPVKFIVERKDGQVRWQCSETRITSQCEGEIGWETKTSDPNGRLELLCRGWMEYDGFIGYRITLRSHGESDIKDVRLEIPFLKDISVYMMGMGHKGGYRPESLDWKWDRSLNQDTLWMGDVNAGLMVRLLGPEYEKPHMLFYYVQKPLNIPKAWSNEGKGGCVVREEEGSIVFRAYSGERLIQPGKELHFDFDLMVTPVKPIDKNEHWGDRYYHKVPSSLSEVKEKEANIVNIHHGTEINPFINYPYFEYEALGDFIKKCHEESLKAKIYYTVKELTVRMPEFWAMRSLNNEILADGNGTGFHKYYPVHDEWMKKYIGTNFIPAWKSTLRCGKYDGEMEASVVVNGMSRYNNFFLEDVKWIMDKTGMDGLYFDDVAFDRTVMRRVRKVLDRHHSGCSIDLHSWNYFKNNNVDDSRLAGWGNSTNLYIDNFPYIDRIWFGEGFDYDEFPDFWLIEMSGIPFGVMGEMLQNGGNAWRGMVYGMTGRLPAVDPSGIWKLWDEFGIQDAEMLGFWNPLCPVKTDHDKVLATAYVRKERTLVSIASWADEPVECRLIIDWEAIGLDPRKTKVIIPHVDNFQESMEMSESGSIPVEPGKGWLIILC